MVSVCARGMVGCDVSRADYRAIGDGGLVFGE